MNDGAWYERLAESGRVPDPVLRAAISAIFTAKVRRQGRGGPAAVHQRKLELLERRAAGPVTTHVSDANHQHYEVPTAFFDRILGPRLKYSACWWPPGVDDLAAAEESALAQVGERAGLADGQRILELGCGWGSLTLWMAERYPTAEITAVSSSATQRRHIEARAAAAGLDHVRVLTTDVAELAPPGRFDRVVSVEMFEHVANHRELLRRISTWLEPDGACFVHVFAHDRCAWEFDSDDPDDWMARHFFVGGIMPSDDLLLHEQRDLAVTAHWRTDGTHYERTLRAWLERLDADPEGCRAALAKGDSPVDPDVQLGRWRLFLLGSAGCWGFRGGTEFGVSHYRFEPR